MVRTTKVFIQTKLTNQKRAIFSVFQIYKTALTQKQHAGITEPLTKFTFVQHFLLILQLFTQWTIPAVSANGAAECISLSDQNIQSNSLHTSAQSRIKNKKNAFINLSVDRRHGETIHQHVCTCTQFLCSLETKTIMSRLTISFLFDYLLKWLVTERKCQTMSLKMKELLLKATCCAHFLTNNIKVKVNANVLKKDTQWKLFCALRRTLSYHHTKFELRVCVCWFSSAVAAILNVLILKVNQVYHRCSFIAFWGFHSNLANGSWDILLKEQSIKHTDMGNNIITLTWPSTVGDIEKSKNKYWFFMYCWCCCPLVAWSGCFTNCVDDEKHLVFVVVLM